MRITPPPPPIAARDDVRLGEDLCLALRDVGVLEYELPSGPRLAAAVAEVQALAAELQRRGVDFGPRIEHLSRETGWRMNELLAASLDYPRTLPRVRLGSGQLRCERQAAEDEAQRQERAARAAALEPFVAQLRTIIAERVADPVARRQLADALDKQAIRYLFDALREKAAPALDEREWRVMQRLMHEWG